MTYYQLESFIVKEDHGAKWLRIFYHNSNGGVFFNSNNVQYNPDSENLYSILKLIPKVRRYDECYEFLLEYPGHEGFNRWKQIKNPLLVQSPMSNEELGFVPDSLSWTSVHFSGLAKTSNNCQYNSFLAVSVNYSDYWHYSIGSYISFKEPESFPGPVEFNAKEVYLYIRVKEFHHLFHHHILSMPYIFLFIMNK